MEQNKNILKYLNKELSNDELKQFKNSDDFKTLEKIAHYSSQIDTPKVNSEEALAAFKQKTNTHSKKGRVIGLNFKQLYKYAAVAAVLLTTSYFLLFNNNTNIVTEIAETKTFNLPDDSEVILNANSTINYSKNDWDENRNLELDGEAFFKVQKGKKFIVNTTIGKVTVLGTQFNVKERVNYFEVKTYEGLVSVSYNDTLLKLPKGSIFKVVNGKIDSVKTFNVNESSWLEKESNFKSTPLYLVLDELENQYNYKVTIKNIDLEILYSGGFTHNNIDIALQSIAIPLQLSYKIENDKIIIFADDKKD